MSGISDIEEAVEGTMSVVRKDEQWAQTVTGLKIPLNLDQNVMVTAERITILDIAAGLANTCRFGGQVRPDRWISVAEHSVGVSRLVEEQAKQEGYNEFRIAEAAFEGLMHDAPEGLGIGDMISPMKKLDPYYRDVEVRLQLAVRARYKIADAYHAMVKSADILRYEAERKYCQGVFGLDVGCKYRPVPDHAALVIHCWDPIIAYQKFLLRFEELIERRA